VPPELDAIVVRATASSRDDRHATARALADEVQRFLDGDRDLERRRTLSTQHTEAARELALKADIASRAEAMREAGSAIALDAGNRDAHAVLMQLLLERPSELPDEVKKKIDDDRQRAFQPVVRGMIAVYAVAVALAVFVWVNGVTTVWPLVALIVENSVLSLLLGFAVLRRWYISRLLYIVGSMIHVAILATVGVGVGPLLLLPVLLFGSLPIMMSAPILRIPRIAFVAHLLAFGIPLALEWLHVVPSTYQLAGNAIIFEPTIGLPAGTIVFCVIAIVILQLVGLSIVIDGQRREQDRAQETVQLQSWQFAQLVRRSGSTS